MHALRFSMYSPDLEATTPIVRQCDMAAPLEEIAVAQPGMFSITDIFEVDDDATYEQTMAIGLERMKARYEREQNMAMHYYWHAQQLRMLNATGTLGNTEPAPLSVEELTESLTQLANHPDYQRQTIRSIAEDWTFVVLKAGEITTETSP